MPAVGLPVFKNVISCCSGYFGKLAGKKHTSIFLQISVAAKG